MPKLALYLLGPPRVEREGQAIHIGRRKALALLAYLAVEGGSHRRDSLATLLWPEYDQSGARADLRRTLSLLRRVLGKEWLLADHETAGLDPDADLWLDVIQFRQLLGACDAHGHPATEACPECLPHLKEAVRLYNDDFMAGFTLPDSLAFDEWQYFQTVGLRDGLTSALERLVRWHRERDEGDKAIGYARRWLELEATQEAAHRHLIVLYALTNQRGAALRQYEMCRQVLADELGVAPSPETTQLFEAIRAGELGAPGYPVRERAVPEPEIPIRRPAFLDEDAEAARSPAPVFVARESELARLEGYLEQALGGHGQMVFITGDAGRGKTALMDEFARRALAAHPELLVASGACDDYTGVGDPYLPFRDVLKMLSGDVETQWAAGAISRDHALRLWHLLPQTARALVEHGPDLIGGLIPGELLSHRVTAYQNQGGRAGEGSGWLDRLQELVRQKRTHTERRGPDQDRIFETYTAVLKTLAAQKPLLLLLDDLHWADLSSVGLMGHLGRRIGSSPILIVGAYRPENLAQGRPWSSSEHREQHPLEMILSELKRHFGDIWIDLDQAEPTGGRAFVDALLDSEPNRLGEGFRRELARHTQGHPLFTNELLQDLQERGDLRRDPQGYWEVGPSLDWGVLPPRVEGVIETRMGQLDADLREALAVASVEGDVFTAELVARVLDLDPHTLIGRLSSELVKGHRLLTAQGIQRLDAQRLSRYRFRHNLFQRYLYSSLDEVERAHRHEAVGNALQRLYGDQVDDVAVQLARHFQEAEIPALAADYLWRAGERAMRLAANEEAVDHLRQGLAVLEALPRSVERCQEQLKLRLALGQAERQAGRIAEALETFQRSAAIARELESAEGLARAALGYEESRWFFDLPAESSARLLADALRAMGEEESVLRARVWASLVRLLIATSSPEQTAAMSRQALEMARRVNDPIALYGALYLKLLGERRPAKSAERLEAVNEMLQLAQEAGGSDHIVQAHVFRGLENLELGDVQSWQADYDIAVHLAKTLRQPVYNYLPPLLETMLALLAGRFEEAEQLAQQALDVGRQLGVENVEGIFGIQMFTLRREQGRLRELAPLVKMLIERDSASATWRPGLALIYSELGLRPEARGEFEILSANDFADLPRDALWSTCLVYLAEVCAYLGDADRAAVLYRLLLPYAGRNVVTGFFTACYGAAAHYLGLLSATMSRWAQAERHFEEALEGNARLGARPWLAHTQYQYAAMLLARDDVDERDRATPLLTQALETARELGMASLVEKTEALGRKIVKKEHKNASLSY
jgi:DNA-binding SARP family transcriptional activator/tetratricopeptide (TPR) repeat protein